MASTRQIDIEAISAEMVRCPGKNMPSAVRLKLTRPPSKEERRRQLVNLAALGIEGPLFTAVWHENNMYLHPAEDDTIVIATSDCFAAIECLALDPDRHITDIPFEDCYRDCPAHHEPEDLIEKPLPEVHRQH